MKIKQMLEWNVLQENFNGKCIINRNIFNHCAFRADLINDKKELDAKKITIKDFLDRVKNHLSYYFASKCEYEVVISDWPPSPASREFKDRKIDIYEQVMMNWSAFSEYLINHLEEVNDPDLRLTP